MKSSIFISLGLLFFVISCSKDSSDREQLVIAQVGSKEITVQDFRINYEFGYAHLRRTDSGEDPRKQILDLMITEALLSEEGYRLGLQNNNEIQTRSAQLNSELIMEQVFTDKVLNKVKVDDEVIRDAIVRSTVSFKIRFYPANSYDGALYVRGLAQEIGFDQALDIISKSNEMGLISPSDFITPEMTWLDLDPDFLESISTLNPGELSTPIPVEDHWFIAEVMEINQQSLSEADIQNKWDQTKQILERNKASAAASVFVSSLMQPLDVKVDATSFRILASILWDWFNYDEPKLNLYYSIDSIKNQPFGILLQKHWNDILVQKTNGNWTIGDFINAYPKSRYPLRLEDEIEFTNNLKLNIGLTLRDAEMLKVGHEERLDESSYVIDSHKNWMDKWVFRAYRETLVDSLKITDEDLVHHYTQNMDKFRGGVNGNSEFDDIREWVEADLKQTHEHELIQREMTRLKQTAKITINEDVLESITLIPDSKNQTFLLFKRSTGAFAYPVVDPNWVPALIN